MELEGHKKNREIVEAHTQKAPEHHYKLMGKMFLRKGLTLYSLNLNTLEVRECPIQRTTQVKLNGDTKIKSKVTHATELIYAQALNQKNAERKFLKRFKKAGLKMGI